MFFRHFSKMGVLSDDPRIQEIVQKADDMPDRLSKQNLFDILQDCQNLHIIQKTLSESFVIPEWDSFKNQVK